jgi:protein TonB
MAMQQNNYAAYDFNDIVFDGRNKKYGAYEIRRKYPDYVRRSFLIAVFGFLFLIFLPKIIMWLKPKEAVESAPKMVTVNTLAAPPPLDATKPPPPPVTAPPPPEEIKQFVPPKITDKKVETPPPPKNEEMKDVQTSNTSQTGSVTYTAPPPQAEVIQPKEDNTVYETVEQQAQFPGGYEKFRQYLLDHLQYPQYAIDNHIEGTVWLVATVSKDGSLSDIQVLKGNPALNDEAIRVLSHSPKWAPGQMNGHIVISKIRIPITFKIQ